MKGTGAYLYAYGKGEKSFLDYLQTTPLQNDNEWTEVKLSFIADNNMDSIRIGCFLGGEGEAWFDDVYLSRLDSGKKKMSKVAKKYLKKFFTQVKRPALDTKKIDWKILKETAFELAAGAETPADVHDAIAYVLPKINVHSFFIEPQRASRLAGDGLRDDEVDPNVVFATGHLIDNSIAYLTVPEFGSGHQLTQRAYADSLQRLIAFLDTDYRLDRRPAR